jgi:hypothetical protein
VELYNLDGSLLRALGGHTAFIRTFWLSRDHKTAITHSNDQICVWKEHGEPVSIRAPADRPFTGKLTVSDDESYMVLTSVDRPSVIQGAWTLAGEVVERLTVPARTSPGSAHPVTGYPGYTIQWRRTDRRWGYVISDRETADQFFVPAKLGPGTVVSDKPDEFGYAFVFGDQGVEWFAFAPGWIREILQRPGLKALLWELDSQELIRLRLPANGR